MSVLEARRHPELRRFSLRRHKLPVAGGNLSIVVPAPNTSRLEEQALDRYSAGGEPPYWGQVWHASVAMARHLCRGSGLEGTRVLDLGCGLGVAGAAAARRGARVTFADLEPDALSFAHFNGLANLREPGSVRVQGLDWSHETLAEGFDLILLADVTYRAVHHAGILRHLRACLGHGGVALHCDPYRQESTMFLDRAGRELTLHTEAMDTYFEGKRVAVRLTWCRPREGVATP